MKIFLLGLPGSGKTTLGKALSIALRLPFVDLDSEIERREGKKITEIFAEKGEAYFRELESNELREGCTATAEFVMATGGGTPCFFDNLEWINRAGKSIFLDVPPSEIVRRMKGTSQLKRPLLRKLPVEEIREKIERMRSERIHFYEKALITLSGELITAEEVMKELNLKRESPQSP